MSDSLKVEILGLGFRISATSMEVGQIGKIVSFGTMPRFLGKHLLRSFDGFILLESPMDTWDSFPTISPVVDIISPGTVIHLTVL